MKIITQKSKDSSQKPFQIYKIKQYKPDTLLDQFSYMLIRPPRFLYNEQILLPSAKYQTTFQVQEHEVPFKLTLYKAKNMMYVILYLHGNSSSRFEGSMHLRDLPQGVGLACFDFSGCGNRFDSEFITLGNKQSKDVDIAANYLKSLGYKVVGWGRSMGSVSLLLSQVCDVMVADSPFSSLNTLCQESSQKFVPSICCCFFHCLYPCLFSCVRKDVNKKAGFDLKDMQIANIIASKPNNKNRSLFVIAGKQDQIIDYSHSQKIFDNFPGTKQIKFFQGNHNSQRPSQILNQIYKFIQKQLNIKKKKKLFQNIPQKSIEKQYQLKPIITKKKLPNNLLPIKNNSQNQQNTQNNFIFKNSSKIQSQNDFQTTLQTNLLINSNTLNQLNQPQTKQTKCLEQKDYIDNEQSIKNLNFQSK